MRPSTCILGLAGAAAAFPNPISRHRRDNTSSISCNGAEAFCDRQYSSITWIGTHNSAFVGTGPADNQHVSIEEQLDMGVRFVTAQTRDRDGAVQLCHSECALLDVGTLKDYLGKVKAWLDGEGHENEVLAVLLTNGDGIDIAKYGDVISEVGLDKVAFQPEKKLAVDEWPTLREMLADGTRVIFYMDYHADTGKVPYILPQFDYIWETPFGVEDPAFPSCDVDRPSDADGSAMMGLVNHVLNKQLLPDLLSGLFGDEGVQIPAQDEAGDTNSMDSLAGHMDRCIEKHSRTPNILLVDWVEIGDTMKAQAKYNDL